MSILLKYTRLQVKSFGPYSIFGKYVDSGARGTPWVSKFGNPLIRNILVLTSAYVHPSVRPSVQTLGEGDGSPKTA